jgi:hypothetical protein
LKTAVSLLALTLLPASAWAGRKPAAPPPLPAEHKHPSGAFTFRTPEDWQVQSTAGGGMEAWGGDLGVRFDYREGENGYDSLHATCIMQGLLPLSSAEPHFRYEYEFMGGAMGDRRVLDTAHAVRYDGPVRGHRDWRQRTVTVVGGGLSLCVMSYAPTATWKKTPAARALLDAVMGSLTFNR